MDFKFKSVFASTIKSAVSEEKDFLLSKASIEQVKQYIPNIDTEKNVDLLPIASNACVINRINKNGDLIDTKTALAIYKNFVLKPIDVEHARSNICGVIISASFSEFGTDKPLTEEDVKNTNEPFNIVLGGLIWKLVSPALADLIEDSADPSSPNYLDYSISWELGFVDYDILELPKGQKNIEGGRLISDASEKQDLDGYLRSNGGSGILKNGKYIYRKPIGNVIPLGIGITEKPAADVKGIAVNLKTDDDKEDVVNDTKNNVSTDFTEEQAKLKAGKTQLKDVAEKVPVINKKDSDNMNNHKLSNFGSEDLEYVDTEAVAALTGSPDYQFWFCPYCTLNPKPVKKLGIDDFGNVTCPGCKKTSASTNTKKSLNPDTFIPHSWIDKKAVTNTVASIVNINVEKLENNISQSENLDVNIDRIQKQTIMAIKSITDITDENLKTATASQISDLLTNAIKDGNKGWLADKETFASKEKEFNEKLGASNKELETLKASVEALQKEKAAKEAVAKFNERMNELASEYDLDEDTQAVLAEDIKAIASDEDFSKYEKKAKVFLKGFAKKADKSKDKTDDKDDDSDEAKASKAKAKKDKDAEEAEADEDMEAKKAAKAKKDKKSDASVVDEAIDNAKKDEVAIANTIDTKTPSLMEKYKAAFASTEFIVKR